MALAAAQVIDAVAARVRATSGLSTKVYTDRAWSFDEAELPAVNVIAEDERIEGQTMHGDPLQYHELDIAVRIHVRAVSDLDGAMHSQAAAVLTKLHDATARTAFAAAGLQVWRQTGIEREMQASAEGAVGLITLRHLVRFATQASAPETILGAA